VESTLHCSERCGSGDVPCVLESTEEIDTDNGVVLPGNRDRPSQRVPITEANWRKDLVIGLPAFKRPLLFVGVLVFALLPLASNYLVHHPDEQYYTAGGIAMLRSGDYLTPRDADGVPRFNKPILTYWLVTASYGLFGIDPLTSRLPFVLIGCGTLVLAYALARMLTHDERAATLAMLVLLSHPQFVLASLRSMTDIVLTFWMLLSAYGFLAILVRERRSNGAYLAAYVGAGAGVATKGLLPVAFVAFVFAFAALDRRRVPLRAFIHLPSMLLGLAVASGWFVLMWAIHGGDTVGVFAGDQVNRRLVVGTLQPLYMVPAILLGYFVTFLPWSVPAARLLARDSPTHHAVSEESRQARRFVISWAVLVAIVFGCAREPEEHYVLPVIPLLAVMLAEVLQHADPVRAWHLLRQSLVAVLGCVLLIGGVLAAVDLQLGFRADAATVILLVVALIVVLAAGTFALGWFEPATAQSLAMLALFPILFVALRPIALPDHGEQLSAQLVRLPRPEGAPLLFFGKFGTAGKLRVCAAGRFDVHRREHFDADVAARYATVILRDSDAVRLDSGAYEMHPGSLGYQRLEPWELLTAVAAGRLAAFLEEHRERFVIATRRGGDH